MSGLSPKIRSFASEPLSTEVRKSVERLSRNDDIARIALMPDVHLAENVCVGAVVASYRGLYPDAVGGDIGCGMAALPVGIGKPLGRTEATKILSAFRERIPAKRLGKQRLSTTPSTPRPELTHLGASELSTGKLQTTLDRSLQTQLGTLGGGNHFLELLSDEQDRYWLMVHTGSRGLGQAVRAHHLAVATAWSDKTESAGHRQSNRLPFLPGDEELGFAYLRDHDVAIQFAESNRLTILRCAVEIISDTLHAEPDWQGLVTCIHNYVKREKHEELWWVHRKGAIRAGEGQFGIIPGSMGAESYIVEGRGCESSLQSSSHGAGRVLSRSAARRRITSKQLQKEMKGIWYNESESAALVDEAPSAYKPISSVMRAQRALTRIVHRLRPRLNYKGLE